MTEFTKRALEMENARYNKEVKKLVESDSDRFNDDSSDESMSERDEY